MASKDRSFEEDLAEVERAIRALEAGDIPLEDSIDLYARAMQHLKACHSVLDRAEARLEVVKRTAEGGAAAVPAARGDVGDLGDGVGVAPRGK
jgi:exodeoxyribonuclease VII small subunit